MATVAVTTRGVNNTAFAPNADLTAQFTGSGAPVPGWTGPASVATGFVPFYAAVIDLAPILQVTRWINIVTTAGVGNATINCSAVPPAGCKVSLQVNNDAGAARTITFGTGFRTTAATLIGTASKIMIITFISDGITLNEEDRTIAMT